jgi:hypothetical protein
MARAPQSRTRPTRAGPSESAAIDRLRQLSVILPAMAQETAVARRDAARLRVENAQLLNRVSRLERSPLDKDGVREALAAASSERPPEWRAN